MRLQILILIFALFINATSGEDILAEESLALQEQDESGRQMSGVGWLCGLNIRTGDACINDFKYTIVQETKFLSEDGFQSSSDFFQLEKIVSFQANENGDLLVLALFKDIEGEYSKKKPSNESGQSSENIGEHEKVKKKKIVKENGVWKN